MTTINIYEAKINLSKLMEWVANGEEVIIARDEKPVAILSPYTKTAKKRVPGQYKDQIVIHPDFDKPLPEFDR
jgi:antitoxin (DNA-binding transcriptional repressor) of toxin-antitoxin stability system